MTRGNVVPWHAALPALERSLRAEVRARAPALSAEHDDFVNDALDALAKFLERRAEGFPERWFVGDEALGDEDRARLRGLATMMLNRRMADYFRATQRWRRVSLTLKRDRPPQPNVDKGLLLKEALRVTLDFLAEVDAHDRALILTEPDAEPGARTARSDAERKRVSRLRRRLSERLREALGEDAKAILNVRDID